MKNILLIVEKHYPEKFSMKCQIKERKKDADAEIYRSSMHSTNYIWTCSVSTNKNKKCKENMAALEYFFHNPCLLQQHLLTNTIQNNLITHILRQTLQAFWLISKTSNKIAEQKGANKHKQTVNIIIINNKNFYAFFYTLTSSWLHQATTKKQKTKIRPEEGNWPGLYSQTGKSFKFSLNFEIICEIS